MKRIAYYILAAFTLLAVLASCQPQEVVTGPIDTVDLRYRCYDVYNREAVNAEPIEIRVKSTKPWTVRSYHPDWCMIDHESGEAVADSLVHVGKGETTIVIVQYYDNIYLDDRVDTIEIASDGFVGKNVIVNQKGSAYLTIPDADKDIMMPKTASDGTIHVSTNQKWTAAITKIEGDWLTIKSGESGEKDGEITISAVENTGEMRYATVTIYDRNQKEAATAKITQNGVKLEIVDSEGNAIDNVKAEWNQALCTINVSSNTHWTVAKKEGSEGDDWYTIQNPDNTGDAVLNLQLEQNLTPSIRTSYIVIKSDEDENGFFVTRDIKIRQAYQVVATQIMVDDTELGLWSSDKGVDPVYTPGVGALLSVGDGGKYTRLNRSMPAGSYAFHWKNITADATVRHWFCYSEGQEIKYYLYSAYASAEIDFNLGTGGGSKPSVTKGVTDGYDMTADHVISFVFSRSGDYCHISVLMDGVESHSFDTSADAIHNCEWGAEINMYIGVETGSAVLDWYEYTPPFSWGD
ncbi:MAG: BACON domain-containing protein [Bacteroidales bacterium]|nr:BACON domain-containing protein [Bacteroidales bacterium]